MRKIKYLAPFFSGLVLLASSYTTFAYDIDPKEKNISLSDSRVPTQYLPIERLDLNDSTGYVFVDKSTIKQHPYNNLIRVYRRVINYGPALLLEKEGQAVPYRSIISQEYVNCDKKEVAKGLVQKYENYFGEGILQNSDDTPKRWESTVIGSKERQNITIICSLPLLNN